MKKITLLFICAFCLFSCQEEIILDLKHENFKYVVEAWLQPNTLTHKVRISKSTQFYDSTKTNDPIRDLFVKIICSDSKEYVLTETDFGTYEIDSALMSIEAGKTYTLYFKNTAGEEFISVPELARKSPKVDNMILLSYDLTNQFASEYLFRINSEGGYPWFTFKDDEGRGDVYTWNEDPNLNSYWSYAPNEFNFNLHNDDLWADGKQVPYPNARLYTPYEIGDTVKLRLSKLSKEVYNFMNGLYAQQGSGGPFGIAPATVIGNVYNKKNSQERALGFFIVSDETYYEKIVSEEDVFTERTPELEEILNASK